MALGDVIARLSVHLGLETAQFEKGVGKAKREVTGMERHISKAGTAIKAAFIGMMGVLAVDQFADLAKRGLEYASSLGEVASQLGVTTKALQEYRYAGSQAGIETGEMDQALSQLTRRIGDAAQGSKSINAAFDSLGVSIRDTNGHVIDAGDAIPLIAEGLKKIESPAERAAILVDLFGKSGQKLAPLLEGGAAGVNGLRDAAHKLGIVLEDDVIQNADDAADKLSAMKQVLEAKIAGFAGRNAQLITDLADKLLRLAEAALKAANAVAKFVDNSGPGQGDARAENLRIIRENRGDIQTGSSALGNTFSLGNRGTTREKTFVDAFGNPYTKQTRIRLPKGGRGGSGANAFGTTISLGQSPGAFAAKAAESGLVRMAQAANDLTKPVSTVSANIDKMADVSAPKLLDLMRKMTPEMETLRNATQGILDRLFPDEAEARRYAEELAILNTALQKGQISADTHARAIMALRREYDGFNETIQQAAEILRVDFGPSLDEISDAISERLPQELGNMANASEASAVRIAQSFADMAESISSSIGNLIGGKTGSLLSSLVNIGLQLGRAGAFGGGVSSFLNSVPAFARGTSFAPGGLSLVGERGPELVNLPRGAQVIPNHRLGGGGDTYHFSGNLMTPEFWAMIRAGDVAAANAGSASAQSTLARGADRRLA